MMMNRLEYQEMYRFGRFDLWLDNNLWDNPEFLKLNLCCGEKPFGGWINLDYYSEDPSVLKHDITDIPWPFDNETFDYCLAMHILEHIPHNVNGYTGEFFEYFLRELGRIIKDEGLIEIHVPSSRNPYLFEHMGHVRAIGWKTFETLINCDRNSSSELARTLNEFHLEPIDGSYYRWHGMKLGFHPWRRRPHARAITDYHSRKYLGPLGEIVPRLIGYPETERFVFKIIKEKIS